MASKNHTYILPRPLGGVREGLLALTREDDVAANRWHHAFCEALSHSPLFKEAALNKREWNWLDKPLAFECSDGVVVIGIDCYDDGDMWPVLAQERDWSFEIFFVAPSAELMCGKIALAVGEIIGKRVYWSLDRRALAVLTLTDEPPSDWRAPR